jgi:hypothetical protein
VDPTAAGNSHDAWVMPLDMLNSLGYRKKSAGNEGTARTAEVENGADYGQLEPNDGVMIDPSFRASSGSPTGTAASTGLPRGSPNR